ncbi:hypothetical protein CXG81DRAFT_28663, partial [Caulochytrium protostelioides]
MTTAARAAPLPSAAAALPSPTPSPSTPHPAAAVTERYAAAGRVATHALHTLLLVLGLPIPDPIDGDDAAVADAAAAAAAAAATTAAHSAGDTHPVGLTLLELCELGDRVLRDAGAA